MSNAMSGGKQAARKIDERLMPEQGTIAARWEQLFPDFEYSRQAPGEPSLSRRHTRSLCLAAARARSQQEVVANLTRRKHWKSAAAVCVAICESRPEVENHRA
jgi:anti-sigma-K factor RskA